MLPFLKLNPHISHTVLRKRCSFLTGTASYYNVQWLVCKLYVSFKLKKMSIRFSPQLNCVWQHNSLQLPQLTVKSRTTQQVYVHTVFQHCIAISALPAELICSLTTWSSVTGMELLVPGCGTQVATTPKCAIIFCTFSSRGVVFRVFYCVVNFVVVG